VKAQEANDLRVQNDQLREENKRLTDLTRMLLSSQAFSGFLQELSHSGLPAPNFLTSTQQQKPAQKQQKTQTRKKDVPNDANQQMQTQQPQIGMALIPETPVDMSMFHPSNAWMTALPGNEFQVYAITELPEAPIIDVKHLSGKPGSNIESTDSSKDTPRLHSLRATTPVEHKKTQIDESVELDPNAFALYFESAQVDFQETSAAVTIDTSHDDLSVRERLTKLEHMCSELDKTCDRLDAFTRE
jgi:hypothetical protein